MASKSSLDPLTLLKKYTGTLVKIRLKSGVEIRGRLENCDRFMNMIISDATECEAINSQAIRKYGKIFIRGNNILFITVEQGVI